MKASFQSRVMSCTKDENLCIITNMIMKKKGFYFTVILLIAAMLLVLAGCGNNLRIISGSASQKGVTVTLNTAKAQRKSQPDRYEYTLGGTIENNLDEGVMKVIYTFAFFDKDGTEFRSFAEVYDGEDQAIPPHSKIDFYFDGIKWGAQSVPAAVSVGISSIQTETDLPPAKLPQPGDYLYQVLGDENLADIQSNPPVELQFHVDMGGYGRTATFDQGEPLDKAVELFCKIKIGARTDEWVTDNYNWIRLVWRDGSDTYISLNLRNLEYSIHSVPHTYELENLGGFWSYAADYLEEDE